MDEHHFICPNTDALFLLGVIQTIFARGLATPGRLAPHIVGWDEIEPMAAQFDMDRISGVTGIARADIERIAVEFANAESAVCYGRTGVSMVEFGGLCHWLMQVVNVITGNMDEEGGMMFPLTAIDSLSLAGTSWDRYRSRVSGRPEFSGEFPMAVMPEEIHAWRRAAAWPDRDRGQSGAVHGRRHSNRRSAAAPSVHGFGGLLPQRNHALRRHHPSSRRALREGSLRSLLPPL
jgi:anaerobic selenocysteine-containing dehydrogenase